jgi:hypothetical protein
LTSVWALWGRFIWPAPVYGVLAKKKRKKCNFGVYSER